MLLAQGRRLTAYAADDAHFNLDQSDDFGGWVQVKATDLTPEALLAALRTGHYYSSQGPEIRNIIIQRGDITVSCSPCSTVLVTGPGSYATLQRGHNLTTCTFSIGMLAKSYLRVTIIDAAGKRAWSNPICL